MQKNNPFLTERVVAVSPRILPQHANGFCAQDAAGDLGSAGAVVKDQPATVVRDKAPDGAVIAVISAEHQTAQLCPDQRAGAHKAGLAAGIQGICAEIGDAGFGAEIPDQPQLCVIGGIVGGVDPVFPFQHKLVVPNQQRAKGFVALPGCLPGQLQHPAHPAFIRGHSGITPP